MKTRIIAIVACIAILAPNIMAQEESKSYDYFDKMKTDHWTINTQGFVSIGPDRRETYYGGTKNCDCPGKYWGVAANVQRKFYMIKNSGFWFGPGVGINFSWSMDTDISWDIIGKKKSTEFGLELNGLAGYTIGNNHIGIDFFAGIVGRLGLYKVNGYWPGTGYARVGFSLMCGHISLTGAFDFAFTRYRHCWIDNDSEVKKADAVTFGIGYSF